MGPSSITRITRHPQHHYATSSHFQDHAKKYNAIVTQLFGVDDVDEFGSSLDIELGDLVIELQQLANIYNGTVKQQNVLIKFAWNLLQCCPASDVRLRSLLGSVFSNRLYELICEVSHALSTHHTIVRTASTFLNFRTVSISLGLPPPRSPKSINRTLKTFTPPPQSQALQVAQNIEKYFPAMQQFLAAQPEKRFSVFSVHRLMQFVRDEDNDEPLPCLKRDYGFAFCTQCEHVDKLKVLYTKIIDN
ncbi:hypothetical protein E8E12_009629 [Didymella heteroderae]|uniref:Uncharacterized protein n=1 Tax=Didymella heteroderae TaxID=1769908 RepID=A0A9P4WTL3_9PLEO|nr:hypothetical protein E8E12_009629 [Didymella heteroderae]